MANGSTSLSEENRVKLDGIVQKMVANKEADEDIQFVVNDFKSKYSESVKKKELSEPSSPGVQESGSEAPSTSSEELPPVETFDPTTLPQVMEGAMKEPQQAIPAIPEESKEALQAPQLVIDEERRNKLIGTEYKPGDETSIPAIGKFIEGKKKPTSLIFPEQKQDVKLEQGDKFVMTYLKNLAINNPDQLEYIESKKQEGEWSQKDQYGLFRAALDHQRSIIEAKVETVAQYKPEDAQEQIALLEGEYGQLNVVARDYVKNFPEVIKEIEKAKQDQREVDLNYEQSKEQAKAGDKLAMLNVLRYQIGNQVAAPFEKLAQGIVSLPRTVTPNNKYGWTDQLAEWADETLDPDRTGGLYRKPTALTGELFKKEGESGYKVQYETLLPKLTETLTTMSIGLAGAAATGGTSGLGQAASLTGSFFVLSHNDYYKEAINQGLDPRRASLFATSSALISSALENVNPQKYVFGAAPKKMLMDNAIRLIKDGVSTKDAVSEGAKFMLKEVVGENVQEFTQLMSDKITATYANELTGAKFDTEITKGEVFETITLTTLVSGLASGVGIKNRSTLEKQSLYVAAMDFEKYTSHINKLVNNNELKKEEGQEIVDKIKDYRKIINGLPAELSEAQKIDAADRVDVKREMTEKKEDEYVDDVIQERKQEAVELVNNDLNNILDGKLPESEQLNEQEQEVREQELIEPDVKEGDTETKASEAGTQEVQPEEEVDQFYEEEYTEPISEEVDQAYQEREQELSALTGPDYKNQYIHDNVGRIRSEDFKHYADRNLWEGKVSAFNIKYFSKNALPLDTIAQEMSDDAGVEITPQDVVDYIMDRELTPDKYKKKKNVKKYVEAAKVPESALNIIYQFSDGSFDLSTIESVEKLRGFPLSDEEADTLIEYLKSESDEKTDKGTSKGVQQTPRTPKKVKGVEKKSKKTKRITPEKKAIIPPKITPESTKEPSSPPPFAVTDASSADQIIDDLKIGKIGVSKAADIRRSFSEAKKSGAISEKEFDLLNDRLTAVEGIRRNKAAKKKSKEYEEALTEELKISEEAEKGKAQRKTAIEQATEKYLNLAAERLNKAFPGLGIEVNESKVPKGQSGRFSGKEGKVYLSPAKSSLETPFHEVAHPYVKMIKQRFTALYNKGISLVKDSPYHERVKQDYKELTEEEQLEEALVSAIGEKGALKFVKEIESNIFKRWAKEFWRTVSNAVRKAFGIKGNVQLENMTLSDFTNLVAKDLLRSTPITKVSFPLQTGDEVLIDSGVLDLEDTRFTKLRSKAQEYFLSRGNLPESTFQRKLKRDARISRIIKDMKDNILDLRRVVKKEYGKSITDKDLQNIDKALKGEYDIDKLPDSVRGMVIKMRNHIDALTHRMIKEGVVAGDMVATLNDNLGVYMTRSYQTYDDPKWAKKVPVEVMNRAKAFIRDKYKELNLKDDEINAIINELLYNEDAPINLLKGGKLGSKNLDILKNRKDIPSEIRALMGEWKDPIVNYSKSIMRMAHLIENDLFLKDIKKAGLNNYFFDNPTGEFYAQISSDNYKPLSPLSGYYTSPDIKKAFEDTFSQKNFDTWLRVYFAVNGFVKYAKTVLSWTTATRNFISGTGFALVNGHVNIFELPNAFTTVFGDMITNKEKFRKRYDRYLELGLVDESVGANELREVIKEASGYGNNFEKFSEGFIKKYLKKASQAATGIYRAGDDVWKVFGFENELSRYMTAYPDTPKSEMEEKVSKIIRDTYPTYSLVPKAVKAMRRFPLTGTFVSFPAEIIRNAYNIGALTKKELGDPKTRSIGVKRLAGSIFVIGISPAIMEGTKALLGYSDDEEEALRRYFAPWTKNSHIAFLGNDGYKYSFIDFSYTDAYNYLKKPFVAGIRGDNAKDGVIDGLKELFSPFLSEEILAQKLLNISRNVDKNTGKKIYNPQSDEWPIQAFEHLWEAVEPGTITSLNRIYKSLQEETGDEGKKYDFANEATAMFLGQRISTLDVSQGVFFKGKNYIKDKRDAINIYKSVLYNRGKINEDKLLDAYETANEVYNKIFDEMSKDIDAAFILGVPEDVIQEQLKKSGLSESDINNLIEHEYNEIEWEDNE